MKGIVWFLVLSFSFIAIGLISQYSAHTSETHRMSTIAKELEYQELSQAYEEATSTDGYSVPGRDYLVFPFVPDDGIYVTSQFHLRENPFEDNTGPVLPESKIHRGLDIISFKQNLIRSTVDGVVVTHFPPPNGYWRGDGAHGGKIVIEDENGVYHSFSHLSKTFVSSLPGENAVKAGDPIARMGDTGLTTGPHLHYEIFEVAENGAPAKWYDPLYYLDIRIDPATGKVLFPIHEERYELSIDFEEN